MQLVLSETALLTAVGSEQIMSDQLSHLRALSRRDHVDLRVLPFAAGVHPG